MILKNLMEDKQLDLDQPFISVRRLPVTAASSEYEDKRKIDNPLPKLIPSLPVYKSELKSGPIRNPGTVPFLWEQTPGRPKDGGKTETHSLQRPPVAPKPPPGRILHVKQQSSDIDSEGRAITRTRIGDVLSRSLNAPSFNEYLMKYDSSIRGNEDKGSFSDSDDDSEAYMDARDTLSRTESSSFLNCSLSGLDGAYVEPSGTFSDPQTRDFMMGRFLPAAKAMASEAPHHSMRKQPVARDQPRQVSTASSVDKRQSLYQHRPTNHYVQHYFQSREVEESEDGSDNEAEYPSAKGCGLLPQLCLLNPVPGLRIKSCVPVSSVPRATAKSLYADSSSKNEKKIESKSSSFRSNGKKLDGSSLYRRMHDNGACSNQNEASSQPYLRGHVGIPGISKNAMVNCAVDQRRKGHKNLRDILANKSTEWELGEASPVVEKTVYIDSVRVVKCHDSDSVCSDAKGATHYVKNDLEILEKEGEREEICSVDSCLQDMKNLHVVDEKEISEAKCLVSVDAEMDRTDGLIRRDQNLILSSMNSKKAEDARNESKNEMLAESSSSDSSHCTSHLAPPPHSDSSRGSSHLPLPPPLPKSPSESWLSRALTSASSRNQSSLGAHKYNRTQACKMPSLDPKWETIVKTSNVHHGHLRFSEELLTPIPEA